MFFEASTKFFDFFDFFEDCDKSYIRETKRKFSTRLMKVEGSAETLGPLETLNIIYTILTRVTFLFLNIISAIYVNQSSNRLECYSGSASIYPQKLNSPCTTR